VQSKEEYMKFYPDNDYVDILGMDLYQKSSTNEYLELLDENLSLLAKIGKQKNKPYAMTEGGLNMIPIENWWTEVLDKGIIDKGVAWALFWRNAWPNHYYGPFKGQTSSLDFKKFKEQKHVLFLKDIKKIK
jgi:mannan endo-1,4-beta-mannosidase